MNSRYIMTFRGVFPKLGKQKFLEQRSPQIIHLGHALRAFMMDCRYTWGSAYASPTDLKRP